MRDHHRVVVEFDDGTYLTKLIHPKGGCETGDRCGQCGRSFDSITTTDRCYDCPDNPEAASKECWVQGWVDNLDANEMLKGTVEMVVEPEWTDDYMRLHVVDVAMPVRAEGQ